MRPFLLIPALLAPAPALAATGPFFSLANTDFIVLLAFLLFLGVLVYYRVPQILTGLLDKRATGIRSELEEARSIREEAQTLLASYERRHAEVQEQADRIVAHAREESVAAADQAKADLKETIARRVRAAEDQIASAEAAAVQAVRDRAIQVAVATAAEVLAEQMNPERANALVDRSIETVSAKLH
jgi:F-type H+-transporting ATPase subunit b